MDEAIDRNAPATKGDLKDLEDRMDGKLKDLEDRMVEMFRDMETKLLQGFYSFA
jgi:hypothetical protein